MVTDTFEQLKMVLLPLGIYNVGTNTVVRAELCAYACGINLVKEQIQLLKTEGFVQTAQNFGLSLREKMLAITPQQTLETRRSKIIELFSTVRGCWKLSEFNNAVVNSGFVGSITEAFAQQRMTLTFTNPQQSTQDKLSDVLGAIRPIVPIHLELRSNLPMINWDTRDAANSSFMYLDKLALTFDSVEQE